MSRLWPVTEDLSPRWYELANRFKSLDSRLISHSNFTLHNIVAIRRESVNETV